MTDETLVEVTGSSDDLIEIDGAIREEFPYHGDDDDEAHGDLLAFSNGVVLRIAFVNAGVWRITPVSGADRVTIVQAPEDNDDCYTDKATLHDPAEWVVHGIGIARP